MKKIKLYNGDCLERMDKLIAKGVKVDAIITDPPYNIVEKMGGSIHLFRQSKADNNQNYTTDTMGYDVSFNQLEWLARVYKLLNVGGHIIIFNDWENMGDIAKTLRTHKIVVKSLNHWQKTNPQPAEWRRRFVSGREHFLHGIKKGKYVFNVEKLHKGNIELGLTKATEKKLGHHPNQKPLALMVELLSILTNEEQTVLDPFMGSGSIGVACKQLNRNFIGIELDESHFKLAKSRVKDAK